MMFVPRCARLLLRFIYLIALINFPTLSFAVEIWFSPPDPVIRQVKGFNANDYMDLMKSDARWQIGARGVRVFEVSNQFIVLATDEQLRQVFSELKRRHFQLAMSGLMFTESARCGHHVEGYAGPNNMVRSVARIKEFGGDLSYIEMDEPLLYGHFHSGENSCHDSIADIARQVAIKVRQAKEVFPNVRIGDVESIGSDKETHWMSMMQQWPTAYEAAVGEPLAFMHADISWQKPNWQSDLALESTLLQSAHIPLGIIYNGSPRDQTDVEWTTNAEKRFHLIESNLHIVPDHAIIQSWTLRPTQVLPEDKPGTMTYLLRQYVQVRGN